MKNKGLIAGFAASALTMSTHAAVFNVASGDWNVGANWDTLSVPAAGELALVGSSRTATISAAVPNIETLRIDGGGGGVLNMNGGSLTTGASVGGWFGGTANVQSSSALTINHWVQNFGNTTLNIGGGSTFTHNNTWQNFGAFDGTISGGSTVNMNTQIGSGQMNWDIVGPNNTVNWDITEDAGGVYNMTFTMDGSVDELSTVTLPSLDLTTGTWNLFVDGTIYHGGANSYTLFDTSSLNGTFDSVTIYNVAASVSYDTLNGDVNLEVYGSLPEPSTFGLLGVGVVLLRSRFRRRR